MGELARLIATEVLAGHLGLQYLHQIKHTL